MRVFVTGASGYIGSAIVQDLLEAGHDVLGLARSDESATKLRQAGADVHRGSLSDFESLRTGATTADGVIHAAFVNDFSRYADSGRIDQAAVEAIGSALQGTDKPLVVTSVTTLVSSGKVGTEQDPPDPESISASRIPSENYAIALAQQGVRSSAVRLPPSVHGSGDNHGFVPALIAVARDKGVSASLGDGENRWPAVHRLDAARLFRLALESAPAGTRLNAVTDEGVRLSDIAAVIGNHLNVPTASVPVTQAEAHFGWLAMFVGEDNPTTSAATRKLLGWEPAHGTLLTDLDDGHYFDK